MEPASAKESIVSRLFGFGRRPTPRPEPVAPAPGPVEEERGFARTDPLVEQAGTDADEPGITVPEQVIRIRTGAVHRKDEVVTAISDSFRELTSMLGSISERLDRQDSRAGNLADQIKDLPEYLQAVPRLQEEGNAMLRSLDERLVDGNTIVRGMAQSLARLPEVHEEQVRAMQTLGERLAEGTEAVHGVTDAVARIPEEIRERAQAQEHALQQMASVQHQTAKVIHAGTQKSLQLFHQATQRTLQNMQKMAKVQQRQMEDVVYASVTGLRRMFLLSAVCMAAAVAAVVALLMLR